MICEWSDIYREFNELYPELRRRGTSYAPYGYMTIEIRIPSVGRFKYNYDDGQLECLEEWTDEREIKRKEKEIRPVMYDEFCTAIERYLQNYRLTQQQFADMVGISSRSISKYLTGVSVPKVSTMRRICETINVNLDERN